MKIRCSVIVIILICSLCGCEGKGKDSNKKEEQNMMQTNKVVTDTEKVTPQATPQATPQVKETEKPNTKVEKATRFDSLLRAEQTEKIKPLNQVKRVVLSFPDGTSDKIETVGIDVGKKKLYLHTDIRDMDIFGPTADLTEEEVQQFLKVLEDEKVQNWKQTYGEDTNQQYVDVCGWHMVLENSDGTIETHEGVGQGISKCSPENFKETVNKIMELKFIVDNIHKK